MNGERRAQGARCLCTGKNSGMNVPGAEIAGVKVLRTGYGSVNSLYCREHSLCAILHLCIFFFLEQISITFLRPSSGGV